MSYWNQGGHPSGNGGVYQNPSNMAKGPPPPSCFFCSGPHFVIDCPTQRSQAQQKWVYSYLLLRNRTAILLGIQAKANIDLVVRLLQITLVP